MITDIIRRLGVLLAAILLVVVFYEGVPIIRGIPFIGHVPVLGWIIQGEIGRRLEGYAALSELTAAKAKADRELHDRLAAQQSLEEARKREAAATQLKEQAHAELEKRIAADAAAHKADASSGGCDDGWNASDDEWLRHH
jgi:hypothetical protein